MQILGGWSKQKASYFIMFTVYVSDKSKILVIEICKMYILQGQECSWWEKFK